MNKKIYYMVFLALSAVLVLSCVKAETTEGGYQYPAVRTYSPETNFSVTALVGDEVTLTGVNLNNASAVYVGGVPATIIHKEFGEIKFLIPSSPSFTTGTNETTITMYSTEQDPVGDPERFSWRKYYYVEIP